MCGLKVKVRSTFLHMTTERVKVLETLWTTVFWRGLITPYKMSLDETWAEKLWCDLKKFLRSPSFKCVPRFEMIENNVFQQERYVM